MLDAQFAVRTGSEKERLRQKIGDQIDLEIQRVMAPELKRQFLYQLISRFSLQIADAQPIPFLNNESAQKVGKLILEIYQEMGLLPNGIGTQGLETYIGSLIHKAMVPFIQDRTRTQTKKDLVKFLLSQRELVENIVDMYFSGATRNITDLGSSLTLPAGLLGSRDELETLLGKFQEKAAEGERYAFELILTHLISIRGEQNPRVVSITDFIKYICDEENPQVPNTNTSFSIDETMNQNSIFLRHSLKAILCYRNPKQDTQEANMENWKILVRFIIYPYCDESGTLTSSQEPTQRAVDISESTGRNENPSPHQLSIVKGPQTREEERIPPPSFLLFLLVSHLILMVKV